MERTAASRRVRQHRHHERMHGHLPVSQLLADREGAGQQVSERDSVEVSLRILFARPPARLAPEHHHRLRLQRLLLSREPSDAQAPARAQREARLLRAPRRPHGRLLAQLDRLSDNVLRQAI